MHVFESRGLILFMTDYAVWKPTHSLIYISCAYNTPQLALNSLLNEGLVMMNNIKQKVNLTGSSHTDTVKVTIMI